MKQVRVEVAVILLGLTVCAAVGQEIKIGDTRAKVVAHLGPPKSRMASGSQEILAYEQVEVTLRNGVVDHVQRHLPKAAVAGRLEKPTLEQPKLGNQTPPEMQTNPSRVVPQVSGGQDRAALLADNAKWYEMTKARLQAQIASERDLLDKELAFKRAQLEANIAKHDNTLGGLDKQNSETTGLLVRDKRTGKDVAVVGGPTADREFRSMARGFQAPLQKIRADEANELANLPKRKEDFEACITRRLALLERVFEAHKRYIESGRTDCPVQLDFDALHLKRPGSEYGTVMDVCFPKNSVAVREIPTSELLGCGKMPSFLRSGVGHAPRTEGAVPTR